MFGNMGGPWFFAGLWSPCFWIARLSSTGFEFLCVKHWWKSHGLFRMLIGPHLQSLEMHFVWIKWYFLKSGRPLDTGYSFLTFFTFAKRLQILNELRIWSMKKLVFPCETATYFHPHEKCYFLSSKIALLKISVFLYTIMLLMLLSRITKGNFQAAQDPFSWSSENYYFGK